MKTLGMVLVMVLGMACNRGDSDQSESLPSASKPMSMDTVAARPLRGITAGHDYWAVYVYAGQPGAEVDKAIGKLVEEGYGREEYTTEEIGCQQGAVQALNMRPESIAVSLYFGDDTAARAFANHIGAPLANVVQIKYLCD
jgi:hypothetical protein